jgi:hypothetical protein
VEEEEEELMDSHIAPAPTGIFPAFLPQTLTPVDPRRARLLRGAVIQSQLDASAEALDELSR